MSHAIEFHLLFASIVWVVAWLLTSLPSVTATTKYWAWVATSVNFVLPLNLIPARLLPWQMSWLTPRVAMNGVTIGAPLAAVWIAGALLMLARLSVQVAGDRGLPDTPAVVGLLRTRIALPAGIDRLLDRREMNAVLAHERQHAKRRDNLIRLCYELSLCALWFHPLVWLTGSRLALYRELSCDEAVPDGGDLISALAKLASPENESLLHATASSFISARIAHLTVPQRRSPIVNAFLTIVFVAVLMAAVVGPVAESAAGYLYALTHGLAP
jgi:hypothetical protein